MSERLRQLEDRVAYLAERVDDLEARLPAPMEAHELRRLRVAAGMSQRALAAELGCSQNAVAKWETGRCRIPAGMREAIRRVIG